MGVSTDFDGNFSFFTNYGSRKITISYVGYKQISTEIQIDGKTPFLKFELEPIKLKEVHIVADVKRSRDSIGFLNSILKKVNEELCLTGHSYDFKQYSRSLRTQSGGGDGDVELQ